MRWRHVWGKVGLYECILTTRDWSSVGSGMLTAMLPWQWYFVTVITVLCTKTSSSLKWHYFDASMLEDVCEFGETLRDEAPVSLHLMMDDGWINQRRYTCQGSSSDRNSASQISLGATRLKACRNKGNWTAPWVFLIKEQETFLVPTCWGFKWPELSWKCYCRLLIAQKKMWMDRVMKGPHSQDSSPPFWSEFRKCKPHRCKPSRPTVGLRGHVGADGHSRVTMNALLRKRTAMIGESLESNGFYLKPDRWASGGKVASIQPQSCWNPNRGLSFLMHI